MISTENVHAHEIQKFGSQADRWWDPTGEFQTLHAINPLRMQFISAHTELEGRRAVDIGCGGGILSEALAQSGADVLGIDLSGELVAVADRHARESGLSVAYRTISAESLAEEMPAAFDVVTCMEMLEHVPEPASVVAACARLLKPGGKVFFSTLNRTLQSYLLAVVAAEYVLRMIPKGTHHYDTFIRPSELCRWARASGLELLGFEGVSYNPLFRQFALGGDVGVNYLAAFARAAD